MGVHVFVCTCMWLQRLTVGIFLNYSPPYFFGSRVSHRTRSSQIRVGWVSSELQGSTCLYHPSAEIASLYWLFTWVLEIQTHVRMLAQENFLSCLLSSHPMNHFSCLQAWCPFLSCTWSSTGLAQQCINVSALKRPFGFFKNISKSCLKKKSVFSSILFCNRLAGLIPWLYTYSPLTLVLDGDSVCFRLCSFSRFSLTSCV